MAKQTLPDELFEFIPELYPFFVYVLTKCDLTGPQFFVLSYIKRSRVRIDGRPARLISDATLTLERLGGFGISRASTIIIELHEKHFVEKIDISAESRRTLFRDTSGGKNKVVILRNEGVEILGTFNAHVNELFDQFVRSSKLQRSLVAAGVRIFRRVASGLIETAHEQARALREQQSSTHQRGRDGQ